MTLNNLSRHGTTDWFKIGKGVWQGCILSPCLFNFYGEYIMWNAGLDESQAGIKITGRNINNLWYVDDPTVITKEELKSLLMRVKEETEKADLKFNILKTKIMASGPITSWQIETEKVKQWQILLSWAPKSLRTMTAAMKSRCLLLGRKAITNLESTLKSRDIILLTKVHLVKVMAFPVVMHGYKSWTIKKAERQRIDAFELWC